MTRLSRYRPDQQKHKKRALILAIMMIVLSVFDIFSSSVSAASSHTTRINLSADQVKQNGNITLTADAIENGSTATSGYTYRFLYNTDGSNSPYPLGDYSSQNWYSFKPADISRLKNYTGAVFIFADSKKGSTNVWSKYKILNIIPNDEESLKATGTVTSAGSYTVGDKLIVTMTASGGTSPFQYKFTYINSSNTETVIRDYGTSDNVTWNTAGLSAGNYTVKAIVKDSNGKTANQKATVSLTVSTPSITSFSVQSTARAGEKIKLNCDAKDGTGTLQYKFTYINASNTETIIKDYSTSDSTTWDTAGLAEGSYTVKAIVKDGNSKIVSQKATIKLSKAPNLSPTVSTDPNNATFVKGKDITFTVDSHSDGTENYPPQPYKYKFEYKKLRKH